MYSNGYFFFINDNTSTSNFGHKYTKINVQKQVIISE